MSACPSLAPEGAFIGDILAAIDCHARTIGESGYAVLATRNGAISPLNIALLTVFVALIGYRMILGDTPSLREAILAIVKIGLILILTSSWSAYRVLVYDVVVHEPEALSRAIGGAAQLPGSSGGLDLWLESVDRSFVQYAYYGPVTAVTASTSSADANVAANVAAVASPFPDAAPGYWDPLREEGFIRQSRTIFLVATLASIASVRMVAGLLLALGPLFAATLLFAGTRGLFEGWVRTLVGTILGAYSTVLLLGVELALLSPWLQSILAVRSSGQITASTPVQLIIVTIVFALTLLAALLASARVAAGFRWPRALIAQLSQHLSPSYAPTFSSAAQLSNTAATQVITNASRAQSIANSINAGDRRAQTLAGQVGGGGAAVGTGATTMITSGTGPSTTRLGQQGTRRTTSRVSASAARRDVQA